MTEERREACHAWYLLSLDERARLDVANPRSDGRLLGEACIVIPSIRLSTDRPHTLRVVQGDREASVTVKAKWRWLWVWGNAFLGPAWPVGVGVDALTKTWTYYGTLDLDRVFRSPPRATS
jgi:hypothetical protein